MSFHNTDGGQYSSSHSEETHSKWHKGALRQQLVKVHQTKLTRKPIKTKKIKFNLNNYM